MSGTQNFAAGIYTNPDAALRQFAADTLASNQREKSVSSCQESSRATREAMAVRCAAARARGRERLVPQVGSMFAFRENAHGGSMARMCSAPLPARSREDARSVPLGYARLDYGPAVNPLDYLFVRHPSGWRVAIPKVARAHTAKIMAQITNGGPRAAGYVRVGDTLVPARLSPSDRRGLAQVASR